MRKRFKIVIFITLVLLMGDSSVTFGQQFYRTRYGSLHPVMGWSSWSFVRRKPTASKIEAQAKALVESGLAKFGFRYVNLDDFWYLGHKGLGPKVDQFGRWVTDPAEFPSHGDENGMKVVADYIHHFGLKFGIYLTPGISRQAVLKNTPIMGTPFMADQIADTAIEEENYNYGGMVGIDYSKPGAQEYINSWADMLAAWGVDFIKLDGMTNRNTGDIKAWSKAIQQSGRSMVLDITQGSFTQVIAPTLMEYADQWEFAPDIECYDCEKNGSSFPLTTWENIKKRFSYATVWQQYSIRGGYNDYDAIEIGNGENTGLTLTERQTQLSLWALESAPLILGADLTHLDPHDLTLLKNTEVLSIDQDGIAAKRFILRDNNEPVFAKIEPNGDAIVGLFNTDQDPKELSIEVKAIGLPIDRKGYSQYNLWTGKQAILNEEGVIKALVAPHGVALFRIERR